MSFGVNIANYAKATKLSIDDAVVAVNSELMGLVMEKTPVDSGRLVSNWIPSFDTPSNEETDSTNMSEAKAKVQNMANDSAGKVFILTNNLPYAYPLEYGLYGDGSKIINGFSKKAPAGMVRVSLLEIKSGLKNFRTTR